MSPTCHLRPCSRDGRGSGVGGCAAAGYAGLGREPMFGPILGWVIEARSSGGVAKGRVSSTRRYRVVTGRGHCLGHGAARRACRLADRAQPFLHHGGDQRLVSVRQPAAAARLGLGHRDRARPDPARRCRRVGAAGAERAAGIGDRAGGAHRRRGALRDRHGAGRWLRQPQPGPPRRRQPEGAGRRPGAGRHRLCHPGRHPRPGSRAVARCRRALPSISRHRVWVRRWRPPASAGRGHWI